jgi:prepilin-type N-terminal cleavage/methylation domain-containing protein
MNFACKMSKKPALKKAGAAVSPYRCRRGGFTLIEVMVVVIIIGILATLAYSSLTDLIFTNRAKETAQTIRSFTERALMDAKRKNDSVTIELIENNIRAIMSKNEVAREFLGTGYQPKLIEPVPGKNAFQNTVTSKLRIGLSGVSTEGYLVACGAKDYCGGAVKLANENSFKAYIRKGTGKPWEAL